ncbi:ATP-dependent nuclease [Mumia sp. DW29H23]|uniref:ATP-dependent nuclease n=1 Tax=Mumia sp. DW29H23 TaxID=3421241 RepID=UPI003D68ECF9
MALNWRSRFAESVGSRHPSLLDGDADNFDLSLDRLTLLSGSEIKFPTVGVTVLVGANNVGKSTLLREVAAEISRHPGHPATPRLILQDLELKRSGEPRDAIAWIGDHSTFVVSPQQAAFHAARGATLDPGTIDFIWQQHGVAMGEIANVVLHYSHAQDRFSFGGSAEMRASISDPPTDPVHHLQDSRALLEDLSGITAGAFGQRLVLDSLGRTIQLRVGSIDVEPPPIDNISSEYRDAMAALPVLDQQGDGMRGFMGQLLPLVTSSFKIIALDEPEAFLHPPQAHGLGQELGRFAVDKQVQVIIATHDRNLLAGLLDSGVDVSVVRLQREDTSTIARQLDAEKVTELWRDPVLKYTNVLDGLFHHAVVLAEAEADCAYYGAALDETPETSSGRDLLFVPTGGKDGMPRVAGSLVAVGVPVVASVDLDLLSDQSKVKRLVEAVGGNWTGEMSAHWRQATNDVRARREVATVGDVRVAVDSVLRGHEIEPFTPELQAQVKAQIRTQGSRWQPVKDYGVAAFTGSARAALDALLESLDESGVVLVKPGELERLAPEVQVSKGPEWLPAALLARSQANAETQAHVSRIRQAAKRAQVSRTS